MGVSALTYHSVVDEDQSYSCVRTFDVVVQLIRHSGSVDVGIRDGTGSTFADAMYSMTKRVRNYFHSPPIPAHPMMIHRHNTMEVEVGM